MLIFIHIFESCCLSVASFKYIYMLIFIQHISAILQIQYTLIPFIFQLFSNFLPAASLFSPFFSTNPHPFLISPAFLHFSLKIHLVKNSLNNQTLPIFNISIPQYLFPKYIIIHQLNNTYKVFILIYHFL